MVITLLAAQAAPVICDPARAQQLVDDAALEPARIPVIQPNLLPGLARVNADPEVGKVLDRLCGDGTNVSLAAGDTWEGPGFGAYTFVLTRSRTEGCLLEQEAVVLSVGVVADEPLQLGMLGRRPATLTPLGDCDVPAQYREEQVLAGEGTAVRLVLISDHVGSQTTHRVVVRKADAEGWHEQSLLDPAPARAHGGDEGPLLSLLDGDDPWIVAHGDRVMDGGCRAVPGQIVWRWAGTRWERLEGRVALGRLADRGAWRLAGEDGWFLIVAQDIPGDRLLLEARARRLQKRDPAPLVLRPSTSFPLLNAGYVFVAQDPWASEADAREAKHRWGRRTGAYVKRGWVAIDPCVSADVSTGDGVEEP